MSYADFDPRIPTDLELVWTDDYDVSLIGEIYEDQIHEQIKTDLRECAKPGWDIRRVAFEGIEMKPAVCQCGRECGVRFFIVDAQATDAVFEEHVAREAYEDDNP